MHHVFQQKQAVAPDHCGDGLAADTAHGAGGRVVQRWRAKQQLALEGLGGTVQGIGQQTLVVHGHANHLQPQRARQGQQARVGERFGQQRVAGPGNGSQHAGQGMLGTVRHHHAVPVATGAKAAQPIGADPAVPCHTGFGLVVQQLGQALRVQPQLLKHPQKRLRLVGRDGNVVGQVNRCLVRVRAGHAGPGIEMAHIGAVTDPRRGQAAPLQAGIGPAHGAGGHAQPFGQYPVRRQLVASSQLTGQDGLRQLGGDGVVFGRRHSGGCGRGRAAQLAFSSAVA